MQQFHITDCNLVMKICERKLFDFWRFPENIQNNAVNVEGRKEGKR